MPPPPEHVGPWCPPAPVGTALSIDLDDVGCYHAIHGLAPPAPELAGVVLERCVPRALEVLDRLGARATFFVIGRDLRRDLAAGGRGARWLGEALRAGHELANHSDAHDYRMSAWSPAEIEADLARARALLEQLGAEVAGFRAPGYTHDAELLAAVARTGHRYDASALPSPLYYLAKLAAIGVYALRGRESASDVGKLAAFLGPRTPWWTSGAAAADGRREGLWELPVSVTPAFGLPYVGTFALAGPGPLVERLRRAAQRASWLHLELHGLDLADEQRDGFAQALVARQPELRVPLAQRVARLGALLGERAPARPLVELLPPASQRGAGGAPVCGQAARQVP